MLKISFAFEEEITFWNIVNDVDCANDFLQQTSRNSKLMPQPKEMAFLMEGV